MDVTVPDVLVPVRVGMVVPAFCPFWVENSSS